MRGNDSAAVRLFNPMVHYAFQAGSDVAAGLAAQKQVKAFCFIAAEDKQEMAASGHNNVNRTQHSKKAKGPCNVYVFPAALRGARFLFPRHSGA